jgi:hypothetical protein
LLSIIEDHFQHNHLLHELYADVERDILRFPMRFLKQFFIGFHQGYFFQLF